MRALSQELLEKCLEFLTDQQAKIVAEYEGGPLRILAIPGSGKTHTMIRLLLKLIYATGQHVMQDRMPACRLISFTRDASKEARERLVAMEKRGTQGCVSTFHAMAMRVYVKLNTDEASPCNEIWPHGCTLRDPFREDKKWITKQVEDYQRAWNIEGASYEDVRDLFAVMANQAESMEDFLASLYDLEADEEDRHEALCRAVISDLLEVYKARKVLPLPLLVHIGCSMLRRVGKGMCKYLIVDEFQDTSRDQAAFCRALIAPYDNLVVVGDMHQSIYGWRGAVPENLDKDFKAHFPHVKTGVLSKNFRSTHCILDNARVVLESFYEKPVEHLAVGKNANSPIPVILCSPSDADTEVDLMIHFIEEMKSRAVPYKEILVLSRNSAPFPHVAKRLMEAKIPFRLARGDGFFAQREVGDAMAYLSWIVHPKDALSGERAIQVPRRGIGPQWIKKNGTNFMRGSFPGKMASLQKQLVDAHTLVQEKKITSVGLFLLVLHRFGLASYHEKLDRAEQSFQVLHAWLKDFDDEGLTPAQALNELFLLRHEGEKSQEEDDQDKVSIMTIHASKGLEADGVFMMHVNDGILPSRRGDASEECNLLYVGMTRARKHLIVSSPCKVFLFGHLQDGYPSRLLEPILEKEEKSYEVFNDANVDRILRERKPLFSI